MNKMVASKQDSTLPMTVQELVCLIFDVDRMKRAMMEFELNLEEMPLGKISKKQVTQAYVVLNDAQNLIEKLAKSAEDDRASIKQLILDSSNKFYSMIPHNFGTRIPPMLEDAGLIKVRLLFLIFLLSVKHCHSDFLAGFTLQAKIEMLENLLEIELAYEMLLEGDKGGGSSIDSHYKTLNAAIDPVEMGSEEYELLEKYLKNTHAETHSAYSLDVEHVR